MTGSAPKRKPDTFLWLGPALALTAFAALYLKAGFIYVINDDWGLYDLLSGAYLGYPDPHVSFMECPVSLLISGLYSLFPALSWYGIFLEICLLVTAILLCRRNPVMFPVWLSMAAAVIMRPQYTTVSGMLMAAAVFLLLKKDRRPSETVSAVALVTMGEWIRPEMLFLFGAFIVPLCLLKCFLPDGGKDRDRRAGFMRLFVPGLAMGVCVLISLGLSFLYYDTDEWRDFRKIDRMRVAMADYYGFPDYDSHSDEFSASGISRDDVALISSGIMYAGRNLSVDQWRVMRDAAREDSRGRDPLSSRLMRLPSEFSKLFTDRSVRPYTLAAILVSIIALISGTGRDAAFSLVSFAVPYLILGIRGRVLDRVQTPLLSMYVCAVAASVFFGDFREKSRRFKAVSCVFAVVMLLPSFMSYAQIRSVREDTASKLEIWRGIRDHCSADPGKLYLLTPGSQTLYYFQDRVLETGVAAKENFLYLGSGHMMNPNTTEKLDELGISDVIADSISPGNDIYYLFEKGCCDPESVLFRTAGAVPVLKDTFEAGGHTFEEYVAEGTG